MVMLLQIAIHCLTWHCMDAYVETTRISEVINEFEMDLLQNEVASII
jgi:hypothetical protein